MSLVTDLLELGQHLRQERLFVGTEREQLRRLYEDIRKVAEDLFHASWIARQQKVNLDTLISMGHDVPTFEICAKNNQLESINFIDSYKQLSHHDAKFGDLFKFLRENPCLLAHCICAGEKSNTGYSSKTIGIIISSVYGNCILPEDEVHVLHLLKTLIEVQLGNHDNPRRIVRRGNSAFSLIFKQLCDSLFSTRLFLTAALHDPAMRLLMEDEWFYDIDPDKALVRFPPKERQRRFGEPGTEEYITKLQNYRKFIVDKLVVLCTRFINSIKGNLQCFPSSLSWVVFQVFQTLTKANKVSTAEIRAICADLVFALFICPAICDPEPYGITSDVPISHIARHNLMQMAQIVQMLAISQWEEIDSKTKDLYGRFEKGCMSSFLDALVEGTGEELPNPGNNHFQWASRSTVMLTQRQLNNLVGFLTNTVSSVDDKVVGRKQLEDILSGLPSIAHPSGTHSPGIPCPATPSGQTPPGTPNNQKKMFRPLKKKNSLPNIQIIADEVSKDGDGPEFEAKSGQQLDDVLVISLGISMDCPGMLSEHKILSWEQENRRRRVKYPTVLHTDDGVGSVEIQEKRTRFSLSHDQESIGNTSDYQEAISEAASSHSVDLENDLENDNDNFSDMMSANVSGRGSPSISGRDTPLSQAGSVEERPQAEFPMAVPETVRKQNREDVTERFGKFEIKAELERDEAKSTVSDTWSTDVLASDSEPPEQNQLERLEEVAEEMGRPFLLAARDHDGDNPFPPSLSEISETASDAWSTDVLASDTDEKHSELLTDLEQDDISCVMERSDNIEDVDDMEDTPLASGGRSPSGERDLDNLGAAGQPSSNYSEFKRGDSLGPEEVFCDDFYTENISGPTSPSSQKHNVHMHPESSQASVALSRLSSDPQHHSTGRAISVLQAGETGTRVKSEIICKSDNLCLPKDPRSAGARPKDLSKGGRHARPHSYNPAKVEAWTKTNGLAGKEVSREVDITTGQSDVNTSKESADIKFGYVSNANECEVDEGIVINVDIGSLADQVDSVKPSEQQNTNFDERRLSATLSIFDPLSPETADNSNLLEGAGGQTCMSAPPAPARVPGLSNTMVPSQRTKSEILISVLTTDEDQGQLQTSKGMVKSTSIEEVSARRDSSDSSQSAASLRLNDSITPSKDSSGDNNSLRSNGDNISQRSDEKDFSENEEKNIERGHKKGFFKSVKDRFHKGIKLRTSRIDKENGVEGTYTPYGDSSPGSDAKQAEGEVDPKPESTDDILDKYRMKKNVQGHQDENLDLTDSAYQSQSKDDKVLSKDEEEGPPFYDVNNLETCFAFQDAKRKLRMVLSTGDFQSGNSPLFPLMTGQPNSLRDLESQKLDNELISLLRAQLAEAVNLQNKDTIAQLHEVIRCIRLFDDDGCKKLVKALREEYRNRSVYISYLIRCRQGLLMSLSMLQRLLNRTRRDKEICNKHLVNVCVRIFIENRDKQVLHFISEFQKLTVSDEKTDLVERFLVALYRDMEQDSVWKAATDSQMADARLSIERLLMSRIYTHAMFPNGDGDFMRDQILHQHIKKLAQIITPTHKYLAIPRMFHFECPWPAAQREIYMINAYKTPKDKLQCVLRCSSTIMNLLSMANTKSVPAADDFIPVLIYIIIKANPPCLLSTIQYVNSFYENRLAGEEQYWWMQFSSAVEFIKTMDYSL